jgi:hypothetical protein
LTIHPEVLVYRFLAATVAFTVLLGPAASAQSPPPPSPVTFTLCRATEGRFNLITGPGTPVLEVDYRNEAAASLSSVRVALVVDGASVRTIDDPGPLAPGATVHRQFRLPANLFPLAAPASCAAALVRYADGTTWTNPVIGPDVGAGLAQTPESRIRVEQCRPAKQTAMPYVTISFVVDAPVAVTRVGFTLLAKQQRLQYFVKEGTFPPGALIENSFLADPNIFPLRTQRPECRVDQVDFADGTSWNNPAAPADPYITPQEPGAQMDFQRCSTIPETRFEFGPLNTVFVKFVNRALVVAKAVSFDVVVNGEKLAAERISGTFSPNVAIKSNIRLPSSLVPLGTSLPACIVSRVDYEDGTSWKVP